MAYKCNKEVINTNYHGDYHALLGQCLPGWNDTAHNFFFHLGALIVGTKV